MIREPIRCRKATFDRGRTYVMGVLNVTPDSFSDGGRFLDREAAVARGRALMAEGADLIDVGGESTRPGSQPVDAATERARVVPVIEALAGLPVPISIDTCKAEVAEAALAAGAEVVNDVSGGRIDARIHDACAAGGAVYVASHLRGTPATMQDRIAFVDLFEEVAAELDEVLGRARAAGVRQVIADPGIGFGKTAAHNVELLARSSELSERLGVPVLVGPSRKAFLGALAGGVPVGERLAATLGAVVAAALCGADFVRVHDVAAARQALAVAEAIRDARTERGRAGMISVLEHLFRGLSWRDGLTAAVDILVVYYLIYRALLLVKGTRAAQMLTGVVLIAGGFFVAKLFDLTTLSWLLDNLINYSIIFFIVIFQHDIRRGLTRVGANVFASGRVHQETFVIEEVIQAAEQLARSRIGALFVLERDADLEEFLGEPGEVIDGKVSKELLVAMFLPFPENTVHDGAVLIKNLRVHRAGCVLPLSANPRLDKSLGTRHRAAIGITEETDAVVVVVSEERGTISLCFGGNIARDLDPATLRKALLGLFHKQKQAKAKVRPAERPGREPATQAAAAASVPEPFHPASAVTTRLSVVTTLGDKPPLAPGQGPRPEPADVTVPEPPIDVVAPTKN